MLEPDWRFALITSSMSAFPEARTTPLAFKARIAGGDRDRTPMG
jgi:hypothetical protein